MVFTAGLPSQSLKNLSKGSKTAVGFIKLYQVSLGQIIGGNCRYYPSCSHYATDAFQKHTFGYAIKLTLLRILRCHPLAQTRGYDPVPDVVAKGINHEQQ